MPRLSSFEGQNVTQAGIEIPRAGGGLHDALRVEPREFHRGDDTYVVLHVRTRKIRYEPVDKDSDELRRVHVMEPEEATFIDGDLVQEQLDTMRARIEELRAREDEQKGTPQLPLGDKRGEGTR